MAHTRSRHTITLHFHCFRICVSCSGSASCPMLHKLRKIQAHFVCTTCWYPHLPQFILFVLWQPCGCIWWYSHMIASKLISLHCHHITPVLTICTAATVNSYFIVWLLPGACFLRHSQGSRLFYLFFYIFLSKNNSPSKQPLYLSL